MSASVPGPKARSHAATSAAVPSASVRGSIGAPSHADHGRPARARRGPRAGVGGPDDGAGRGQRGQHVRPNRHLAGPCLAFAVRDRHRRGGAPRRAARRRSAHGHPTSAATTSVDALFSQRAPLRWRPNRLDETNQAAALQRGHAFARARLGIGQPLAREDEQRPPHREVLHERPIDVQRALEVGHRHAGDAGLRGEEDRRWIGGVQADHAACRLDDVGGAVRRGQAVTPADPGSTFGDGETAWCGHAARS